MQFNNIKNEKKKWVIYRLIYCLGIYCFFVLLYFIMNNIHPLPLVVLVPIVLVVFIILLNQDAKTFKGIEEFNKQNYDYVFQNRKSIIRLNALSLEKLGAVAVLGSAFNLKEDDYFLELIHKMRVVPSDRMLVIKAVTFFYYYMYCVVKNDLATAEKIFNENKVILTRMTTIKNQAFKVDVLKLQRLMELMNRFSSKSISNEEKMELENIVIDVRIKEFIAS